MTARRTASTILVLGLLAGCGSEPGNDDDDAGADVSDTSETNDTAASEASGFCDSGTRCGDQCVDTTSDGTHCGGCGNVCEATGEHDRATCIDSQCVRTCEDRWYDLDVDGTCEWFCVRTNQGIEACDGLDNDCDGAVDTDDDSFANLLCAEQRGVCVDSVAMCRDGVSFCDYRSHAGERQFQVVETRCDNRDNDCDGQTDETCCMPATVPLIDDSTSSLEDDELEVFVAGVGHEGAVAHLLIKVIRTAAEVDERVIWRAESSSTQLSYHPTNLRSQLPDAPDLADGVFRDAAWDVWYVREGAIVHARLEPDSNEPAASQPVEAGELPSPIFGLRAFAVDARITALYVANNDEGRIYVIEGSSEVIESWPLPRDGATLLGVWRDADVFRVLDAIDVGDEVQLRIRDVADGDATPLATLVGAPMTVPFVEDRSGGLVGAAFVDGNAQVVRVGPAATFETGESIVAEPWQCVAAWSSEEGALQLARYLEVDGSGQLELRSDSGGIGAGWVGSRLCPLTARSGDDLTSVAVGLMSERLSRRVALVSIAPSGEYYCAESD